MGRPARYNVDLVRGDSKTYKLTFTNAINQSIDITSWIIYYTVKKTAADLDTDAVIRKTITIHTDPTHGITNIELENTDTQNLDTIIYWHDVQINIAGKINTICIGQLNVIADVTRTH
jgi:hypothetical protein